MTSPILWSVDWSLWLPLLSLTLCIGIVTGCTGIGGLFVPPMLVFLVGLDIHEAVASSMIVYLFMTAGSCPVFARYGHVDWRAARWVTVGIVPLAVAGAFLGSGVSPVVLTIVLAVVLFTLGLHVIRAREAASIPSADGGAGSLRLVVTGAVVGLVAAIIGAGGPVLLIPALASRFPLHRSVGISQVAAVPLAIAAISIFAFQGSIQVGLGCAVGVVAMVGTVVGARRAHATSADLLRRAVAIMLMTTGLAFGLSAVVN